MPFLVFPTLVGALETDGALLGSWLTLGDSLDVDLDFNDTWTFCMDACFSGNHVDNIEGASIHLTFEIQ